MRRHTIAVLGAALLLLAWSPEALAQKERRFKPRKPLPYPQRVTGVGPVLASPPSARYVAWRYGYRPIRVRSLPVPHHYPYQRLAPGALVIRPHPRVAPPFRPRPARVVIAGSVVAPTRLVPPPFRPLPRPAPRHIPVRMLPGRR